MIHPQVTSVGMLLKGQVLRMCIPLLSMSLGLLGEVVGIGLFLRSSLVITTQMDVSVTSWNSY